MAETFQHGPMYLEDLQPGMRFRAPTWPVTETDIIRFASEFDPQPHHVDPQAAKSSFFGGLAASGWHTAAMIMGMAMRSDLQMSGGQVGIGVENLTFSKAVRPGDVLSLDIEILAVRPSRSRHGQGIFKARWRCTNQHGETVMEITPTVLAQTRAGREQPSTETES